MTVEKISFARRCPARSSWGRRAKTWCFDSWAGAVGGLLSSEFQRRTEIPPPFWLTELWALTITESRFYNSSEIPSNRRSVFCRGVILQLMDVPLVLIPKFLSKKIQFSQVDCIYFSNSKIGFGFGNQPKAESYHSLLFGFSRLWKLYLRSLPDRTVVSRKRWSFWVGTKKQ